MLALVLVLAAATPFQESLAELARSKAKDPQKLHRLFDLAWQYDNAEHPELATSRGVAGYNNRWTDESLEAIERRKHETVSLGQALSAIDRRKVDAQDQVNYDLFRRDVDDDLAAQRFPRELLAITQLAGPQYLSSTLDIMPARTARDYQDIVARLDAVPQRLAQVEARLRRGVETGVVCPRVILHDVAAQLDAQTPEDPLQAPLLKAFAKLPEGVSEEARTDAVRIYREKIVPAYRKLREYFVSAYLTHARETVALSGSPEAHRPGSYFVNTYKLDTRPKWEMEALTLHESVPGHHLQNAISQELTSVPEFRKTSRYVAFVEGWGLYAESLGPDLGMYQDPYSQFGQLTYEMWRAIRLVVDTGMHALGWSREQAIDYFRQNSAKTEHDIVVEIDRYIVMPGQALAYKIGELKLKELRALASKELGAKFDVRTFHDAVLGSGALPLDLLEENIRGFIAQQRR